MVIGHSYKGNTGLSTDRIRAIDKKGAPKSVYNLKHKLHFILNKNGILWSRVGNFDETCVQLFPANLKGWSAKYKKHCDVEAKPCAQAGAKHVGNITVTWCISSVVGTVLTPILFEGTSERTIHSLLELVDTHEPTWHASAMLGLSYGLCSKVHQQSFLPQHGEQLAGCVAFLY